MWFDCVERKRRVGLPASVSAPRAFANAPSRRACVRAYVNVVRVCVYMCMCVCVLTCIYVCMCMCVCMYMDMCAFIHMCMCMCMHICTYIVGLSISTSACGQCHACACVFVRICMRMYMCVGMCMCAFFAMRVVRTLEQVFWTLVHGQVCTLHRCVFTPMYTSAHTLATGCVHMCIFIYMCIYMHMYMDAYVRLWYCRGLTRWGVVTKIFYLCIHVHMHAYVYVCTCMRV